MTGTAKYGPKGLYTVNSFPLSTNNSTLAETLSMLANHALTKSTWSTYRTAGRMLTKCFTELGIDATFPLNQEQVFLFVGWLHLRKLAVSTINSYLAGVRQLHLTAGLSPPLLRTNLVSQVLSGKSHLDAVTPAIRATRLPVTPSILRLIKLAIGKDDLNKHDARLFWFLCSLAFHGAFRMGELLNKSPISFDPSYCLLRNQVSFNSVNTTRFLEVSLASTKTSANKPTVVDVFPTNNDLCPIRAYSKWLKVTIPDSSPNKPLFRLSCGKLLTPEALNKKLKVWLNPHLDFTVCKVSGHSFRAGLVSVLGGIGFDDADLKKVGRWSSRAYELYIKLPRTKRRAMAVAMGNLQL